MPELIACTGCGAWQSYRRMACQTCGAREFAPAPLPAAGAVYSVTVVLRAPDPSFAELVPYTVTLVRGAHGGLLLLPWAGPAPAAIGDAAEVRIHDARMVAAPARNPWPGP